METPDTSMIMQICIPQPLWSSRALKSSGQSRWKLNSIKANQLIHTLDTLQSAAPRRQGTKNRLFLLYYMGSWIHFFPCRCSFFNQFRWLKAIIYESLCPKGMQLPDFEPFLPRTCSYSSLTRSFGHCLVTEVEIPFFPQKRIISQGDNLWSLIIACAAAR